MVGWNRLPAYDFDLTNHECSRLLYDRHGSMLRVFLSDQDAISMPVDYDELGEWLPEALMAAEDKRFSTHRGIDPLAIMRAMVSNVISRRVVSGASTLTTLVVKLTQPRRRSMLTKIIEMHHAFDLEDQLSKQDIMTQYFNRAPFGGNIIGIRAASEAYFSKRPSQCTLSEAALLVGLPQQPSNLRPDRYMAKALWRRNYVLGRMLACGFISEQEYQEARNDLLRSRPRDKPFQAPHYSEFIVNRYDGVNQLQTTLDMPLQSALERMVQSCLAKQSPSGELSASLVVMDVHSSEVRAFIGSPDYFNPDGGQVNGGWALRSPGSTLKPFIYAMAFDQGICTPESMIADIPRHYEGYDPFNYDLSFNGPVSVREALVDSLNIPALELAETLGQEQVVHCLRNLGLSSLSRPARDYGISIALGSCEVRMLELVNAYAALAREGVYKPYRLLLSDPDDVGCRVFSPAAAYLVSEVLSGDERAMKVYGHVLDTNRARFAFKTGTSSGHRDAWTIAWTRDTVVGLWVGRVDGQAVKGLSGLDIAAPLAAQVMEHLGSTSSLESFQKPSGLQSVTVCALSGDLPGAECPRHVKSWQMTDLPIHALCTIHENGGLQYPGPLAAWMTMQGRVSASKHVADQNHLVIEFPADGDHFQAINETGDVLLQLRCVSAEKSDVYWFADDDFLGTQSPVNPMAWRAGNGTHSIRCVTGNGLTDTVIITVD
jgi:penicillin-binding protein 1C